MFNSEIAKVVNFEQGSDTWHAWRLAGVGASEVAALYGESPYLTELQLYELKKGTRQAFAGNFATERGTRLESEAVAYAEEQEGELFNALCVEYVPFPAVRVSLDGAAFDGSRILEIKVPGAEVLELAALGELPRHYWLQVQYQLLATGAPKALYYAYDHARRIGFRVEVLPDLELHADMLKRVAAFMKRLADGKPPAPGDRDVIARDDAEWLDAAQCYADAKADADAAAARLSDAKERLVKLAGEHSSIGGGVRLTRSQRVGAVDYKKVPELKGVDLEKYRKKGTSVVSVSIVD